MVTHKGEKMSGIDYMEIVSDIGIEKGDIIDVASALRGMKQYCDNQGLVFEANYLIDALIEKVGSKGTVMIRTFNWDFCDQVPFDILHTPSQVGALGTIAMKRWDFRRTQHPIYSWTVWGKHQDYLCDLNNTCAFGEGTPFEFLYKNNAKMVRIGNTNEWAFTQRHHAEKLADVPYRYEKVFEGNYIDRDGISNIKKYSMFVRHLDMEVELNDYLPIEQEWEETGVKVSKKWNDISCCSIRLKEAMDYIYDDLIYGFGSKTVVVNGTAGYQNVTR